MKWGPEGVLVGWLVGWMDFYGISTFIGYLMPKSVSPMVQEIEIQSRLESYQRLKKLYLMPPCLALSIIR